MNAPTLIVGLGGKGSDVALRVSKMVTEEQRQRIGFAVFDTDVNELRQIKQNNEFVHTIQTSTKLSVGEYLDIDTHCRDTWFPVNAILNSKTLTEGAGQVRAVSRMAFETAVRAGKMEELHHAIEDLYKLEGEEYQQALRVIIVSSLAGGTGSGLILPVALYIKNYLATRFRQSANITRGFFLLPEVFYSVIPGQAERNNLKSNAYATLREIDAFIMKGDATLPEKFNNSVRMEFPSVSSDEFEEFNIRPYDFCFLFDAQNADGKKMDSFEDYLNHAANCIYAQSIGPMNKRSNSSEDNTIRKLAAERGRNRYAGAGTSMLIYPTEDIKRYLALNWAKENVSDMWLMFDKAYRILVQKNAEMRRKGIHVPDIKVGANYIASVETEASNKNPFALAVQSACTIYDPEGITVEGYKWIEYMNALSEKVKNENDSSGAAEVNNQRSAAQNQIDAIEAGSKSEHWEVYVNAYNELKRYYSMIRRRNEEIARNVAYSIFRNDEENVTKGKEKFRLETYMRNEVGGFIHPCAVRYFLYKVLDVMTLQYKGMKQSVSDTETYFEKFEERTFDDSNTDVVETVNDINKTIKVTLMDKIFRRLSAGQEDLQNAYREYLGKVDTYRTEAVYVAVLEEGIAYVQSLCEAFESFFRSFDSKVTAMNKEISNIESRYESTKGKAARYVCASRKCLTEMRNRMSYLGGAIEMDSELAEAIYNRVRNFSVLAVRSEDTDYFNAIFDEDIVKYFTKKLMESYSTDVDLDIIDAIAKEAEYEQNIIEESRVNAYIKQVIDYAKILAAPFIEKPLGEEKDPINSCAYNDKLSPKDDSPKARLINSELKDFGGEPDSDISKNMILFYKSFYGLRANDLSKFAPPQDGETYDRAGGEYFKAYYELVSKIHPVPSKSKVITPHIDRWWHIVTKMPDLDDGNQEKQLYDINAAFFWGLVNQKIALYEYGNNQMAYRLGATLLGDDEDSNTLTVSNGTPCDQLYEVLDALAIYPEMVQAILKDINEQIVNEIDAGKTPYDNGLKVAFDEFSVRQITDFDSDKPVKDRSIFELPFMLKKSMTSEVYDESEVIRLIDVIIKETLRIIKRFASEKEYTNAVSKILIEQYEKLVKNLDELKKEGIDLYKDYLFNTTFEKLTATLNDTGLKEAALYVSNDGKKRTK